MQLPFTRLSLELIVFVVEQLSVAVAEPRAAALILPLQLTLTLAGHEILGAVISRTVITCKQVELFPHSSVAFHTRFTV